MSELSISGDMYVASLEQQCKDWEVMYANLKAECANLKAENEQLKKQLDIAMHPSAMTEPAQLRHV